MVSLLQPQPQTPSEISSNSTRSGISLIYSGVYNPRPIIFGVVIRPFHFNEYTSYFEERSTPRIYRIDHGENELLRACLKYDPKKQEEYDFYPKEAKVLTYDDLRCLLYDIGKNRKGKPWLLALAPERFFEIINGFVLEACYKVMSLNDLWNCFRFGLKLDDDLRPYRQIQGGSLLDMAAAFGYDVEKMAINIPLNRLKLIEELFCDIYGEIQRAR